MKPPLFTALALGALVSVAILPQDVKPASSPSAPAPISAPASITILDSALDPVAAERAANQKAFDEQYLAVKELIFDACAGQWVAIANGAIHPTDVNGRLQPASDLDALLRYVDERAPKARHRFVFRVGEEGDLRYHFTLCNRPEFVGHNLLTQIGNVWISATDGTFKMPHDGPFTKEAIPLGRGDGADIVAEIGAPRSVKLVSADFLAANIYGGTAVVSAAKARELGLDLWEIPGRVESAGRRDMRRARMTFRIPKVAFDKTLTIAVEEK